MSKNLYLNIDDDFNRAFKKISQIAASDVTLVVPKDALIFSDSDHLRLLKSQVDALGKNVSILTMDSKGQRLALELGFELKSLDQLRKGGPGMDMRRSANTPVRPAPVAHKPVYPSRPEPKPPVYKPRPEPVQYAEPAPAPKKFESNDSYIFQPRREEPALQILEEPIFHQPKSLKKKKPEKTGRLLKWAVIIGIIILIALATIILPQADITVYARVQPISRDMQILVDSSSNSIDPQKLLVPGQLISEDQSATKQYQSTGQINVGNKAEGTVQIYNFTNKTLKLGAGTTYLQVGTKVYHFKSDITGIKPTRKFAGTQDVDPSSLIAPVPVIADQPGEDYNLAGNSTFEVHNNILGSLPSQLYAKNPQAIEDGSTRLRSVITQLDLDNAKADLNSQLAQIEKQRLAGTTGLTLLDSGYSVQNPNITFDKKAGDQVDQFTGSISGHISGLAFSPNAVKAMVEQRVTQTLDAGKYLVTGQKEVITESFKSIDYAGGSGILQVHFESIAAPKIDTQGIASQANGKTAAELKESLLSDSNIDSADVAFKPFWVNKVPSLSGRVYVTEQLHTQ